MDPSPILTNRDDAGTDVDVLIVGAGVTGIYQLYRARQEGFSVTLVESGDGVGGTWYWNRYPGARFDSESYTYGYLFDRDLFEEWEWSEHFAAQPETERYLNHVVDRFDLRREMRFGFRVSSAVFDDESATWVVTDQHGSTIRTRFLISATGVLSVPYLPAVDGIDTFAGESHHTGRWPSDGVDFTDKRVGVVGTSSSGVQVVPTVLDAATAMTVFQRSANWCTPLNNRPITPDEQRDLRSDFEQMKKMLDTSIAGFMHPVNPRNGAEDTTEARHAFFQRMWDSPGFTKLTSNYADLLFDDAINDEWCAFIAERIRSIVEDPATAERLIPKDHRYGEKRPPFVTGYFEAFNDPKTRLVDLRETPMVRVTKAGIETTDEHHDLDVIVWATGFDFGTGALARMGVVGRNEVALTDHWADGPTTFLGLQTRGFPNLFFPGGPHAAAGNNPRYNSDQVDFVTELLVEARARGRDVIEPTQEAEERWGRLMAKAASRTTFGTIGQYVGGNIPGKARRYLLNSAGRPKLFESFTEVRDGDYADFDL